MYFVYSFGSFLAGMLPKKVAYLIAKGIVGIYFLFAKKDKDNLRYNLSIVLGKDVQKKRLERHVWMVFKNFAKYLVDFFKFPRFSIEHINRNIMIEGREHLDKALTKGKGVVLVSLHLGNWELGGAIIGALQYPVGAIALEHPNKKVNAFFNSRRAMNNIQVFPAGAGLKECIRSLKKNRILGIIGDKDYLGTGIPMDFFGKKAFIPRGPAAIALKTGAPLMVMVTTREKGDRFLVRFEPPVRFEPEGDTREDIKKMMSEYLRIFEKYIRRYPDQWYVFGEVWARE